MRTGSIETGLESGGKKWPNTMEPEGIEQGSKALGTAGLVKRHIQTHFPGRFYGAF